MRYVGCGAAKRPALLQRCEGRRVAVGGVCGMQSAGLGLEGGMRVTKGAVGLQWQEGDGTHRGPGVV